MAILGGSGTPAAFSELQGGIKIAGDDVKDENDNIIYDQSASEVPESAIATLSNSALSNSSVTVAGKSVSLGNSVSVSLSDLSSLDASGSDITDGTETIWNSSGQYIPQTSLENENFSLNANDGLTGDSGVNLGGTLNISANPGDFAGSFLGVSGTPSDLDVQIGSGLEDDGSDNIRLDEDFSFDFTSQIDLSGGALISDDTKFLFGTGPDFSMVFESQASEWVLRDESNGVDLIRQPKQGPTEFIQGADIGSVEAPEDSFTQIINSSNTTATTAGSTVGYTFSVNNQTVLEVRAESDGSGGLQSRALRLGEDLETPSGNLVWDNANTYIPNARLESDLFEVVAGDGLKTGGSASLGGSVTLNIEPADFAGAGLTDDGSDDLELVNDSVTINGTSVSLGGSISVETGNIDLADDEEGLFGTNDDFSIRYDSAKDNLVWEDNTNNNDKMELDRTSGDLSITGELTEGSAL